MAGRKKQRSRIASSTRITDEELIERICEKAPELLTTTVLEAELEGLVNQLLKEDTPEQQDFYCRRYREYHLKSHPQFKSK